MLPILLLLWDLWRCPQQKHPTGCTSGEVYTYYAAGLGFDPQLLSVPWLVPSIGGHIVLPGALLEEEIEAQRRPVTCPGPKS